MAGANIETTPTRFIALGILVFLAYLGFTGLTSIVAQGIWLVMAVLFVAIAYFLFVQMWRKARGDYKGR